MYGRSVGRRGVTSWPNQNFSHWWVYQNLLAMGLRARSSAIIPCLICVVFRNISTPDQIRRLISAMPSRFAFPILYPPRHFKPFQLAASTYQSDNCMENVQQMKSPIQLVSDKFPQVQSTVLKIWLSDVKVKLRFEIYASFLVWNP